VEHSEERPGLVERALPALAGALLRAIGATLRIRREGDEHLASQLAAGRPAIVYGWHGNLLVGACDLGRHRPLVMISQSRDGERIARTVEHLDFQPVRGSSSRGGARALLQMVRLLRGPVVCCHLVDGPRGPRGEIKPGLVLLAQRSGAALIPIVYGVSHKWVAKSWDRMVVPLPFARVVARRLPARFVPRELDEAGAESLRLELEEEMRREQARIDAELAGQPTALIGRTGDT
jgi:lysophospholipid acyltransferase (LPLAT)-like uncharacterized protein